MRLPELPGFQESPCADGGIRAIFCTACDDYGVHWTTPRRNLLSVARREDTARLDLVVGPKT